MGRKKKIKMNTTPFALFVSAALTPRQAEHQGKVGGSKRRGETEGKQVTQRGNKKHKTISITDEISNKRGKCRRQALMNLTGEAMRGARI